MMVSGLIGIIADDLTGANEAALQFHLRGSNTQILLDIENSPQNVKHTQTWAVSTATRMALPVDSIKKVSAATIFLMEKLNLDYFFQKIDSALRGNIAVESLAILETLGWDAAVIIPSHPADNKTTVGGYQLWKGVPIERTDFARNPFTPIKESHVPTLLQKQLSDKGEIVGVIDLKTVMQGAGPIALKMKSLISSGKKLIVADSVSITDIEQVILAMRKSGHNILPVGTAATAQVLGNIWLPELENQHVSKMIPKLPKLILSGSSTPITLNQIEKFEQTDEFENTYIIDVDMATILGGVKEELVERVVSNLSQNNIVMVHSSNLIKDFDGFSEDSLNANMTKKKLIYEIAVFMGELAKKVVNRKDIILITLGAETSYKCCDSINSNQLQIIDEIAPAVALTLDHKAQWIVSKSGYGGNLNTLIEILKYFDLHT